MSARTAKRRSGGLRGESDKRRKNKEERGKKARVENYSIRGVLVKIGLIVVFFVILYVILHNSTFNVEKIEVEGNEFVRSQDIIALSGISEGDRLFKIHPDAAEGQISLHVMIDDVNVRVRPFHTVLITVEERNTVACLVRGNTRFYIDDSKTIIEETAEIIDGITEITGCELPDSASIGVSLANLIDDDVITLVQAVKGRYSGYEVSVPVTYEGEHSIAVNGVTVRLGTMDKLDEKLNALGIQLKHISVLKLESLEYIDLTVPDEPILKERSPELSGEDHIIDAENAAQAEADAIEEKEEADEEEAAKAAERAAKEAQQ